MKKLTVLISFLLFFSLFSVCFLSDNANATTSTNFIGFEDGVAGTVYAGAFLSTTQEAGNFYVSTSNPKGGTKSYAVGPGMSGFMKIGHGTSLVTNITFYWDSDGGWTNNNALYIILYNTSLATGKTVAQIIANPHAYALFMVKCEGTGAGGIYGTYDETGSFVSIGNSCPYNTASSTINSFVFLDDLGNIDYTFGGSLHHKISTNCSAINNGSICDGIAWYTDGAVPTHCVIDNMSVTLSDSYSGGSLSYCGIDVSGYTQFGTTNTGKSTGNSLQYPVVIKNIFGQVVSTTYYGCPYITAIYNVPLDATITGVALQLSPGQYLAPGGNDPLQYECWVNGQWLGYGSCIFAENWYHVIYFPCTVVLNNEVAVFDFYHGGMIGSNVYWDAPYTDYDNNNDGVVYFKASGFSHTPGAFAGDMNFDGDLGMLFFTTTPVTQNTYTYPDSLGLFGYSYKNTTGSVYYQLDNIVCSSTISNPAYSYTVELWHNGTQITTEGFPKTVNYPSDVSTYTPLVIGKYVFKLKSSHYVANATAWVLTSTDSFKISTNPPITNRYESYNILYKYYHLQGYNGYIAMTENYGNISDFDSMIYTQPINSNTTGSYSYSPTGEIPQYWTLFVDNSGVMTRIGNVAVHLFKLTSILDNTIGAYPSTTGIGGIVRLSGTHLYPGCKVDIKVNNVFLKDVGSTQQFNAWYTTNKQGLHNATLSIEQNGTTILLAYTSFTVTRTIVPEPTTPNPLFDFLTPYKLYIGIAIVVLMTLIPLIAGMLLASKTSISVLNIPGLVYVAFFLVGIVVSTALGLFELWVLFFVLFALILVFAITWISGKSESGG